MAKDTELDLEAVNAGVAYTLYATALVGLATAIKKQRDQHSPRQGVVKYAQQLHGALVRCGINTNIPTEVGGADDILRILQSSEIMLQISNLFVQQHSRRQELIFILTCVVGGVFAGSVGGASSAAEAAKPQAIAVGSQLGVPESVIAECFKAQALTPLRAYLQTPRWSEVVEPKPSIWGFTFDLKKMLAIVKEWFAKRKSS